MGNAVIIATEIKSISELEQINSLGFKSNQSAEWWNKEFNRGKVLIYFNPTINGFDWSFNLIDTDYKIIPLNEFIQYHNGNTTARVNGKLIATQVTNITELQALIKMRFNPVTPLKWWYKELNEGIVFVFLNESHNLHFALKLNTEKYEVIPFDDFILRMDTFKKRDPYERRGRPKKSSKRNNTVI